MNTSKPGPEVRVERDGAEQYRIRLVNRAGLGEKELEALLMSVYEKVNPASAMLPKLPPSARATPDFAALYQEGPVLFKSATVNAQSGESSERVAGLKVSDKQLAATIEQLEASGFVVVE